MRHTIPVPGIGKRPVFSSRQQTSGTIPDLTIRDLRLAILESPLNIGPAAMAYAKRRPEAVLAKKTLATRLALLRIELFGDRGASKMARRLEIPVANWYDYEAGVTVPDYVILRLTELTSVEPMWLLHGRDPKYRAVAFEYPLVIQLEPQISVNMLIRAALDFLERESAPDLDRLALRLSR